MLILFVRYWQREGWRAKDFDDEGWFRTGDRAVVRDGRYYILGRESADILKVGGYKISALDIERELLENDSMLRAGISRHEMMQG